MKQFSNLLFFVIFMFNISFLLQADTFEMKENDGRIDLTNYRLTIPVKVQAGEDPASTTPLTTEQIDKALKNAEKNKVNIALLLLDKVKLQSGQANSLLSYLIERGTAKDVIEKFVSENAKSVNTMFYKKGKITQIFRLTLTDLFNSESFPEIGKSAVKFCDENCDYTGLVVNLPKGTAFQPALTFTIRSESKKLIYDKTIISFSAFKRSAMATFIQGSYQNKKNTVGDDPLTITASSSTTADTIVIKDEDANEITDEDQVSTLFKNGRVVVVFK